MGECRACRACFRASGGGRSRDGPFEELREAEVERDVLNTRDEWIANLLSVSSIAHQSEEDRAAFASRLRELVPADREVRRRIRTVAHWTRRV